jgi:hypothetical protein
MESVRRLSVATLKLREPLERAQNIVTVLLSKKTFTAFVRSKLGLEL